MTLWASRDGQTVTIHGNTGLGAVVRDSRVAEFSVSEHVLQHLKHFWGQLGVLIEQAEAESRAAAED